ncbi:MAG: hypothetical protein J1D87_04080 [Lachnospiraceae bacterium]|nr:hypothetical protein [Lachnospiraceae bacterium]
MKKKDVKIFSYRKGIAILLLIPVMMTSFACGNNTAGNTAGSDSNNIANDNTSDNESDAEADSAAETIEGDLQDIMKDIYAGLEGIDAERKETMQDYIIDVLTEDNEQAMLGTADIDYTEGIFSVPMISSIAYQCVLLRVNPDDIEDIKQQLKDNADLNKWVCVSAETVLVENVGDLVLFIMSDKDVAYAVSTSFQSLNK